MMAKKYVEWLNQLSRQGTTMFDLTKRIFYAGNSGDCRKRTRLVVEQQKTNKIAQESHTTLKKGFEATTKEIKNNKSDVTLSA